MFSVEENLKRSSEKIGLRRVVFDRNNIPSSMENVTVFVFFFDMESSFTLSSLILKRIKEEINFKVKVNFGHNKPSSDQFIRSIFFFPRKF